MDEQSLPIDIHCGKLLDWLISRRHCGKNWTQKLNDVRQKIKKALEDMPESEEIAALLANSQLDYFSCQKIVEILKKTEADTKNIFGYYSSQRMKDWQEVAKLYEEENLYLVEAAQKLIRNVQYEVPGLKKQLNKLESATEEVRRKQVDCVKQANVLKADYANSAAILGIKGKEIRQELLELLNDFPTIAAELHKRLERTGKLIEYYQAFASFVNGKPVETTPTLFYLLKNGNTTFYEYVHGEKPEVIEEIKAEVVLSEGSAEDDQIDFGDESGGGGIDFGEETASSEATSGENGDFVHLDSSELDQNGKNDDTEINWGDDTEVSVIETNPGSKIAKGADAYSIIEHQQTRNLILNELAELEGFFDQRLNELSQEADVLSGNFFQNAPSILQITNKKSLETMLGTAREILAALQTDKLKLLCLMKDNPKYIDNAVAKLTQKLELSSKNLERGNALKEKESELGNEIRTIAAQIPPLIAATRQLQSQIEEDISKRYKGRPVNIMAGVQML